jgi:hypothetical protein
MVTIPSIVPSDYETDPYLSHLYIYFTRGNLPVTNVNVIHAIALRKLTNYIACKRHQHPASNGWLIIWYWLVLRVEGHTPIIVFIDACSKWPVIRLVKWTSAIHAAQAFVKGVISVLQTLRQKWETLILLTISTFRIQRRRIESFTLTQPIRFKYRANFVCKFSTKVRS